MKYGTLSAQRVTNVVDCQVQPTVASGPVALFSGYTGLLSHTVQEKKSLERDPERL